MPLSDMKLNKSEETPEQVEIAVRSTNNRITS